MFSLSGVWGSEVRVWVWGFRVYRVQGCRVQGLELKEVCSAGTGRVPKAWMRPATRGS